MPQVDSVDKIVLRYFAAVTAKPFTYKGQTIEPKLLHVSSGIIKGYTCNKLCGGCCSKFSLDYLPTEKFPYDLTQRTVVLNDKPYIIFSDFQEDNKTNRCNHLNKENGLCMVHGAHPFSCDFELIRFISSQKNHHVTQRLFGRGWNMKRVDGGTGALCTINEKTEESRQDAIRKLLRLKQWADWFELDTKIDEMIAYCSTISLDETQPLLI